MRMFARGVLQGLGSVLALAAPGQGSRSASPAERLELTFGLPGGGYDPAVLDALPGKQPLDCKGWHAEITKMTNVFGAPIAPEEAKTIVDYLAKNYGIGE